MVETGWVRRACKFGDPSMINFEEAKRIWVLKVIVEAGSLKQAAATLKVTPSAISQSLRALEESLGKVLLVRNRGLVEATPEAIAILEKVSPAFAAFEKVFEKENKPMQIGSLSFGTYESLAIDVIPHLLAHLRLKIPKIRLKMTTARTAQLLTQVRKGELCMALIPETDDLDRLYTIDVATDTLGFFAAKELVAQNPGWNLVDKIGLGMISSGQNGFPLYYSRFLRAAKLSSNPVLSSDSIEVIRGSAEAGGVVALLPRSQAEKSKGLLVEIKPPQGVSDNGEHRIVLVSPANCDREESDFLADELRAIFQIQRPN